MSDTRAGCIGLGNMGGHIAENILRAGFELTVFDVRAEALARLESLGAQVAGSPEELGAKVDVVVVTVLNDAQVENVLLGPHGALGALAPDSGIIIHSTVSPATCRRVAAEAELRSVVVVDAPISGGEGAARSGTLTLMIGGSEAAVSRCEPLLEAVSAARFHVGDIGAGEVAKLVNNLLGIVNRIGVGEGLALARKAGLREDVVIDLLKVSTGNSWQVEHWREMQEVAAASTTGPEGMAAMAKKDLGLALQLATELGIDLPVTIIAHDQTAPLFSEDG
jgi:3-hydroxyisobutyrate dehydrogenase-like beta-hydroxyacid dehydrogenase